MAKRSRPITAAEKRLVKAAMEAGRIFNTWEWYDAPYHGKVWKYMMAVRAVLRERGKTDGGKK